jgi:hypothetical protein
MEDSTIREFLLKPSKYKNKITTVYMQGMNASSHQASKYAGSEGVDLLDDTIGKTNNAPLLAYNIYVGEELEQIGYQATNFQQEIQMIGVSLHNWWNNIDAKPYHINLSKTDIGQKIDIATQVSRWKGAIRRYPDRDIVLYGVSRGAATTFSSVALCEDNKLLSKVKLVILEGVFDTLSHCLESRSHWNQGLDSVKKYLPQDYKEYPDNFKFSIEKLGISALTQHDFTNECSPLSLVDKFPKNIPIGIVYTTNDSHVPNETTENLIDACNKAGLNVHVLKLKNSRHSTMSLDDTEDRIAYKNFVEDLYSLYL